MATTKATSASKTPKTTKVQKPKVTKAPIAPVAEVKKELVKVKYQNKNLMISPRKLRLAVDALRKLTPAEALTRLKLTNTKAARHLVKSVKNVIADAKHNFGLAPESLTFDTLRVDEGLKIKRMDKSHGSRFARGLKVKRHSRLEIIVKGVTQ